MTAEIIEVDFKKREVVNRTQTPTIYTWQCSFCKGGYSHTEGAKNNVKYVAGGTMKHPAYICEICAKEVYELIKGA
jgi:hypothetical protein